MTEAATLREALAEFERIVAELGEVSRRSDSARRGDLIRLRRALSNQVPIVRDAGIAVFASAQPTLANELRSRLSNVRSAIALHQANWPAVGIDENSEAYRTSAAHVAAVNGAFAEWLKSVT